MQKRVWAARLLLSVFLPILVFSSLHIHQNAFGVEGDCYECANHLPHGGHISLQTASFHDCVLCQFVSLSYVAAVAIALAMTVRAQSVVIINPSAQCLSTACRVKSLRAPPVI
ncbi:MAG: hypothetical protein IJV44_02095 [Prevotella sp.]|nr:hypothetical protein [Prevotella sp.]